MSVSRSRARSTSMIGPSATVLSTSHRASITRASPCAADEFRRQPALADAGVADDGHQPRRPRGDRVVEDGLQPSHLVGPADERGGVGGLGLAAEPLVHRHGRGPPLDLHLAEGLVAVPAARRPPRLLADHDAAARALGLESGSDVQRVADEVGVAGPDHDLAGVHRDAQGEFDPVGFGDLGGEVDEALLQFDRGVDGVGGVVGPDLGDTPDGHEPVADVLRHARPMALRGRAQQVVVAADDLARRLGVDVLLEAGRTGQVGEHDGHRLARRTRGREVGRRHLTVERQRRSRGRTARSHWLPPRRSRTPVQAMRRSPSQKRASSSFGVPQEAQVRRFSAIVSRASATSRRGPRSPSRSGRAWRGSAAQLRSLATSIRPAAMTG